MRRLLFLLFCISAVALMGQPKWEYRYWFDNADYASAVTGHTDSGIWHQDIDVSHLPAGLHMLHYQLADADTLSAVSTVLFLKSPAYGTSELLYRYLVDGKEIPDAAVSASGAGAFAVDVAGLDCGIHVLEAQALSPDSVLIGSFQGLFCRVLSEAEVEAVRCLYYFDGELAGESRCDVSSGLIRLDLDASAVDNGIHTLTVLLMTEEGITVDSYSSVFLRKPTGEELASMKCYYKLSDGSEGVEECVVADGLIHADLDFSELPDGEYEVTVVFAGEGMATDAFSALFTKNHIGTSIMPVTVDLENDRGTLYDLQGRRVERPVRGNVYLRRGEKIFY